MSYKVLVFDFFGVICSDVAPIWFQRHVPAADAANLKDRYISPADRGDVSQERLFLELSELSSIPSTQIEEEWFTSAHINQDMVEFLKELKGSYKLGLLTNAISPFFPRLLKQHGLEDMFNAIVISNEIHHAKPEPESYRAILEKLGVQPSNAVMIDDNPVNIEGARRVGMSGIVFQSYQQLRKELEV